MDIAESRYNTNSAILFTVRSLLWKLIVTCQYFVNVNMCGCLFSFLNVSFLVLEIRTSSMPDFYCKCYCISLHVTVPLFFVFCLNIATIRPYVFRCDFVFAFFLLNLCEDHYLCWKSSGRSMLSHTILFIYDLPMSVNA